MYDKRIAPRSTLYREHARHRLVEIDSGPEPVNGLRRKDDKFSGTNQFGCFGNAYA